MNAGHTKKGHSRGNSLH